MASEALPDFSLAASQRLPALSAALLLLVSVKSNTGKEKEEKLLSKAILLHTPLPRFLCVS